MQLIDSMNLIMFFVIPFHMLNILLPMDMSNWFDIIFLMLQLNLVNVVKFHMQLFQLLLMDYQHNVLLNLIWLKIKIQGARRGMTKLI